MVNLENILKQQPTLTPFGIEGPGTFQTTEKFDADCMHQIEDCINWLSPKTTQPKINRKVTSYAIKHIIEREMKTYVSNGCLIAAVIHLGIPYKRIAGTPNIHLAIGTKELYKNDPGHKHLIHGKF